MSAVSVHGWRALCAAIGVLAGLAGASAQPMAEAPVKLAPHRAVYDIGFDARRASRIVDSASGRLAFDLTGDACTGYAMSFRQVTRLESAELGPRTMDNRMTTHEEADNAGFRFKIDNLADGVVGEATDGRVLRKDGGFMVRMTKPKAQERALPGGIVFPTAQLKAIIQAARRGETTVDLKVFDGSDEGQIVYDTLTLIGPRMVGGDQLEGPIKAAAGLADMPRWPVKISYFKPGDGDRTPSYSVAFELFENGISRAVVMDYNQFVLLGTLTRLETYPATACQK